MVFEEPDPAPAGGHGRDNNMRAAVVHVMADAAVSVLVIIGLSLARSFGWMWMDPLAGIVGACVIASWSYGLIRDTGIVRSSRAASSSSWDAAPQPYGGAPGRAIGGGGAVARLVRAPGCRRRRALPYASCDPQELGRISARSGSFWLVIL